MSPSSAAGKEKAEEEEGKYAKARRQSRGGLLVVLSVVVLLVLVASHLRHNKNGLHGNAANSLDGDSDSNRAVSSDALRANRFSPPARKKSPEELLETVQKYDAMVRKIKQEVDIFETDAQAQKAAKQLQDATRELLYATYGSDAVHRYRVHVTLEFQSTIPDYEQNGKDGSFVVELAPSSLVPHSVYTYLEVARHWKSGAFHRIAGHVLQVMVKTDTTPPVKHLAFQEYSPEYPHKKRTVGYAGRPSGPAWYVSIQDNSRNHGPGSQQNHNPYEADGCMRTVVSGRSWRDLRNRCCVSGRCPVKAFWGMPRNMC